MIFFCWLIPEILSLELWLFSFLHSLCWFCTYPVPGPAWAGLEIQWWDGNLPTVPRKRQTEVSWERQQGTSGCVTGKMSTPDTGKREVGPRWQRVHSMQHYRQPGPKTLLCKAEDSGRERCCTREWYHIYMLKCKWKQKGRGWTM